MSRVAFYGTDATGYLAVTGVCEAADLAMQNMPGITYAQGTGLENPAAEYLLAGVLTPRPVCPVASSTAARVVTLTGVPSGAAYSVSGAASFAGLADSSGTLTLTFGAAGTYQIAVACFPAIDFAQSVTLA